jgi:hypothetical protein
MRFAGAYLLGGASRVSGMVPRASSLPGRVAQCEWRSASRALGVRVPDPCQSLRDLRVDACSSGSEVAAKGDDKGKRTGKGGNAGRGSARLQGSLEVSPRLKPKPQTLNPRFTMSPKPFHTRKLYQPRPPLFAGNSAVAETVYLCRVCMMCACVCVLLRLCVVCACVRVAETECVSYVCVRACC